MLKNHKIIENLNLKTKYLNGYRFNATEALTKFVLDLEKNAQKKGLQFKIVCGSIHNYNLYINNKVIEKNKILFDSYIGFIYDKKYYYIQMDENSFFNHYFNSVNIYNDEKGIYYNQNYYLNTFKPFNNVYDLYIYNQNAIDQIVNNLNEMMKNHPVTKFYKDKKRNDKKYIEKRIYTN